MATWYSKKWIAPMLHVAAWVVLLLLPLLGDDRRRGGHDNRGLSFYIINNLFWVILFYLNAFGLMRMFNRQQYPRFILSHVGLYIIMLGLTWANLSFWKGGNRFPNLLIHSFIYLFIFALSTAYRILQDRLKGERLAKERENENLKTELSLLRSQVSPHFMFNVLNNMVALARKKSDLLEPSLIKLSSLMRYMLYETDEEKVALEKEVEYLQSYIDLQQQRFGKNIKVNVSLNDVDGQYFIEPMLLIPFVENAFKHGTGLIENAFIDIELRTEGDTLHFTVRNKYNNSSTEIKDKSSGIGLTNVKRRLNLLYNGTHKLEINKKDHQFIVSLELKLHS